MAELLHYLDKMEYRPAPKERRKVLLKRRPESQETTTNKEDDDHDRLFLDIVDKRPVSGFKRTIIKEFERFIGTVQEKKSRKEGEPRRGITDIYVEHFQETIEELEVPVATQADVQGFTESVERGKSEIDTKCRKDDVGVLHENEAEVEPVSLEKFPKLADLESREDLYPEKEPKTPEDKSRELDERLEEIEEEEPTTPEDKSRELEERLEALEEEQEQEEKGKPGRKKKEPTEEQKGPKKTKRVTGKQTIGLPKVAVNDKTEIDGEPVLERVPERPSLDKLVVRAPAYYMANRKLYLQNITKLFSKFSKELLDNKSPVSCDRQGSAIDFELLIHQRIVREYLNVYTPYRGLLLYHGLGSGKTCTSIAIAEAAKTHKRIFVMTPASLKMNFFSELKKCGDSLYKKNQYWEFISVEGRPEYVSILSQILGIKPESIMKNGGAWLSDIRQTESNYSDLSPENQKSLDEQLNEMIRAKYVDINYNGLTKKKFDELVKEYGSKNTTKNPFDHSVVLVDEAHNLVSRIVNNLGKKDSIAAKLYEYLQSATDARIVFMSGTPIINYPQEMGVMFNMLRGYIKTWKFTIPTTTGAKLTSEKILKMFHDGGLKTFDYIDYSNDTLSVTRNPFGFVNVDNSKKTVKVGNKVKVTIPKTKVTGGKKTMKEYENDSDSDSETESETKFDKTKELRYIPDAKREEYKYSISEAEERTLRVLVGRMKKPDSNTKKKLPILPKLLPSSRKTKKQRGREDSDEPPESEVIEEDDGETEIRLPFELNKGAIELRKEKEIDLSDEVKDQIEREIHQERNEVGEDPYHSGGANEVGAFVGGAPIVDNQYSGIRLDEQGNLSDVDFERKIKEILTEHGIKFLPKVELVTYKSLPDTKNEFSEIFIDMDTLTVQRPDVLKKRILGLTSYFRSAQESLLPSFVLSDGANGLNPQYHIEYVEMSDQQFIDYTKERALEIDREPKKKKTNAEANKEALKVSGSYRTFTRAKCNFSFPPEIPRPMPPGFNPDKDVAANALDNINDDNELDIADMEDDQPLKQVSGEYERAINKALADLKSAEDQYLSPKGLEMCSPKFAKILENLKDNENKGLHLVYSAFRTLEGVGVLKLVLEANGFAEFKLKKTGDTWSIMESDNPADNKKPKFVLYTGTETAEEKEIIRNVYNSNWDFVPATISEKLREINANNYYGEVIKIIMITSSGAEGINLENTRFVHIVEPYWHMVRVDQVVGRARRICSHKNLPESLRTIKVFLYMCKFSDKQRFSGENVGIMNRDTSRLKKVSKTAKTGETSITTDETLFEIAVIKDRLTKQLLKSVKESSVDCSVYDNSKEGLVCYTYGHATSNEFGAFPSYGEDRYVREGTDVAKRTVKIDTLEIAGKKYAHNTETGELYDFDSYKNTKKVVLMGRVAYVRNKPVLVAV